ncbi:MAG TPA: VOC family protein [Candidatus Eremiobacteraceae bacterium]|nr:VOC family protein [Candidatus Eremiobacteraceae bacterium]
MKPRINIITLAVSDLERALRFYRDLGFKSPGIVGEEFIGDAKQAAGAVVMFKMASLTLALYPRAELAKDANIPRGPAKTGEFSIGQLVDSRKSVDAVLEQAKNAGATIVDPAHERPWGIYSGYFRDLDGHLWEIIYNP